MRPAVLLLLACLGGDLTLAASAAGGLDALMHLLAQRRYAVASFIEVQQLAALKRPLRSQGELAYQAPDRLEERTLGPHPQDLRVEGNAVTVQLGSHTRHFRLQEYPQLAPTIEAIRATLAGDRGTLERLFRVHFTGTLAHWQLELRPRRGTLAGDVSRIEMQGNGAQIERIEMLASDGDRSVMRITPLP